MCSLSFEVNAIPQARRAAVLRRLVESLHQLPAICLDDALGGNVIGVGRDLHVLETFRLCRGQQEPKSACRVPAPLLPGHDGITDVAKTMRWESAGSCLPTKA